MSVYERHKEKWRDCERCTLCTRRRKVVLCRGKLPCHVLFVGEAPGISEDVLGLPFIGPAGKLLDQIIAGTLDGQYDYAITNLVGCIPLDDEGKKVSDPPKDAVQSCLPRLREVAAMAQPELIIRVGRLATKFCTPARIQWAVPCFDVIHPAAILRMDVSQQGLAIQRCCATLEAAIDEIT